MVPFLRNVTAGKDIPDERLVEVGQHYYDLGGRSPINDQNRTLIAAIEADLAANGVDLPVYWGNRNWDPYLRDALEQMKADGITRAAALLTSAYSSYSGCRQYRENLADAVAEVPGRPPDRPAAALLQPPRLHRADGRRDPGRARRPARGGPPRRAPRLRHALDPDRDERPQRSRAAAPTWPSTALVAAEIVERVREETGHRYPSELVFCSRSGPAAGAVAGAGRQRPPARAAGA